MVGGTHQARNPPLDEHHPSPPLPPRKAPASVFLLGSINPQRIPKKDLEERSRRRKPDAIFDECPHSSSRFEQLRKRQPRRARHLAHAPLDHRPLHTRDRLWRERDPSCRVIRDELLGHRFWRVGCTHVGTGEVVGSFFDDGDFAAVGRRSEFFCGMDGWYY